MFEVEKILMHGEYSRSVSVIYLRAPGITISIGITRELREEIKKRKPNTGDYMIIDNYDKNKYRICDIRRSEK